MTVSEGGIATSLRAVAAAWQGVCKSSQEFDVNVFGGQLGVDGMFTVLGLGRSEPGRRNMY
jgi:hypothetical protein